MAANLRGAGFGPGDTLPEETALLSGHEPPLLRDASPASGSSAGVAAADESLAGPNHTAGFARSTCIGINLFLLIFVHSTNMSGLTMIQGSLAQDLHSPSQAMWFTTSYLIAMSSLTPLVGRLASIFSPRSVILPSVALFSLGSLAASRARSFAAFMVGRAVMGCGGAGIVVMAVIFVIELTDKRTRGVMIGFVNATFTMGVSVGAAVYGVLQPVVGWRPLFWLQSPVVFLAGVGLYFSLPESMASPPAGEDGKGLSLRGKLASIDYLGAALLTLTIVLFLYSLAGDVHPVPLVLSLLSLLAFVAVEHRLAPSPIIPLSVLSSRGVLFSCLAQLGLLTARWSILFYVPVFILAVRGAPPAAAGSVLIATNIGFSLGGLIIGWLHIRRAGPYYLSQLFSLACVIATIYALSIISCPATRPYVWVATVCLNGITTGIALNYALVHVLHLSHANTEYITTSLLATFRGFGGSFGTSLGGGIFYRILRSSLTRGFLALDGTPELGSARRKLVDRLLGSPDLVWHGGVLEPRERQIAVDGYADAIRGVWQAAAVLGAFVIAVQAAAGWTSPREEVARRLQREDDI
ncbi:MFS general substrate transporter [Trichoderma ceciliae]